MIHVIMIPNHEIMISFGGGKQGGNPNYVTITICNSVKISLCIYIVVIVITHKPRPQTTQKHVQKTNKMCPVKYLLKMSYNLYNTISPQDLLIRL